MPKFSVIMPSRIAQYPSSARNKENKLLRAVNSVIKQTFADWELNIIADGCRITKELVTKFITDVRVNLYEVDHKQLWSGRPRNKGIDEAKGDYIIYLDIDDIYRENHLQTIAECLAGYDWVWFNDIRYKTKEAFWYENQCDIRVLGRNGTSNICHKKLDIHWNEFDKYAHDYHFTQKLLQFANHKKISTPEYYVCHVPGTPTSGGYDL